MNIRDMSLRDMSLRDIMCFLKENKIMYYIK